MKRFRRMKMHRSTSVRSSARHLEAPTLCSTLLAPIQLCLLGLQSFQLAGFSPWSDLPEVA